jgi:hypothetical protein
MRPFFEESQWSELPLSIRNQILDSTVQQAWEHLVEGANAGGLDNPQTHVTSTPLELDAAGYEEMTKLLAETLERAQQIHAESASRRDGDEDPERTELTIFHYHRPGDEPS